MGPPHLPSDEARRVLIAAKAGPLISFEIRRLLTENHCPFPSSVRQSFDN
jgi:hypothetical protein